jgi:exodeoxyribonuclease V alpha subunit
MAADNAPDHACLTLETVHRFADADYADLTLDMRTGQNPALVFDALLARGDIKIHASDVERVHHLSTVADAAGTGGAGAERQRTLVVADTREQVAALNAAIRDHRSAEDNQHSQRTITTGAGERVGVGDTITTRRNDRALGVANRQTWTITGVGDDGSLTIAHDPNGHPGAGRGAQGGTQAGTQPGTQPRTQPGTGAKAQVSRGERTLPAVYAKTHVELGYARTVYGAQGETVDRAHFVIGEQTGAASAYVAMTRGRELNTAHLVADDIDQAREQWVGVFSRDRADLGPPKPSRSPRPPPDAGTRTRYPRTTPPAPLSRPLTVRRADPDLGSRRSFLGRGDRQRPLQRLVLSENPRQSPDSAGMRRRRHHNERTST